MNEQATLDDWFYEMADELAMRYRAGEREWEQEIAEYRTTNRGNE